MDHPDSQEVSNTQDSDRKNTAEAGFFQGETWDAARFVFIAFGLTLLIRMFVFQPFNIPSGSMRPTLLVGDFLYVSKTSYGYSRASLVWPLNRLPVHGRFLARAPQRGDVIVFKNKNDGNSDYIKRLIGLPGDTIFLREGTVFINGKRVQRDFLGLRTAICDDIVRDDVPAYRETLDNGVSYTVNECHDIDGLLDTRGPYLVPTGHYFMMGDNRDQSRDSRVTSLVGTVPFDDFVGRAERVVVSVDGRTVKPWQVWRWPEAIRGSRSLKSL